MNVILVMALPLLHVTPTNLCWKVGNAACIGNTLRNQHQSHCAASNNVAGNEFEAVSAMETSQNIRFVSQQEEDNKRTKTTDNNLQREPVFDGKLR